jgi:signal transduction histidine kinase
MTAVGMGSLLGSLDRTVKFAQTAAAFATWEALEVVRGVDELAAAVAALSRALGTALDPSSVLARTVAALDPVLPLGRVSLWRTTRSGVALVACHPPVPSGESLDLDVEAAMPGAVKLSVGDRGDALRHLIVQSATGEQPTHDERALLDIAASQVTGALERAELFTEVMELERLKSDFIARVSHELRTPITIINGFLETMIAHEAVLDSEQRLHMLERSRVASSRLGHLIEELLILSRLEGGVLTPQPETLVMADVLDTVRAAAGEPDQVLVTGPIDQPVVTDRSLLVRALGLLVDNAIKYGGVAELSTRVEAGRWIVEVRDRGPGFADDIRSTAFEMFARSRTATSVPGLGVGLAIARTLVEVLDGTVTVEDAPTGPGSIARISLPA